MEAGPDARLLLPGQQTALIIGKQGATLRDIRDSSGAALHVMEKDLPSSLRLRDERVLCIGGGEAEVKAALQSILEIVTLDELCLLVPEAAVPHIIGSKGDRIKQLIQSSGCNIQLSKQPLQGVHATRRLTIQAQEGQLWDGLRECARALADLMKSGFLDPKHFELLDDSLPDAPKWVDGTPLRFLVDEEETCWIVGKKGNKVTKYRDICRLSVDDSPCAFDDGARSQVVTLDPTKGPDAQRTVLQLMLDDLGVRLEKTNQTRLLVPAEVAGKVSGRGEENLRDIEKTTKTKIDAPMPAQYQVDRVFNVKGDEGPRVDAIMMIQKLIQEHMERKKNAPVKATELAWGTDSNKRWITPDSNKPDSFAAFNSNSNASFSSSLRPARPSSAAASTTKNGPCSLYSNPTGEWRPPISDDVTSVDTPQNNSVETWTRGGVGKAPSSGAVVPVTRINWSTNGTTESANDRAGTCASRPQVSATHINWSTNGTTTTTESANDRAGTCASRPQVSATHLSWGPGGNSSSSSSAAEKSSMGSSWQRAAVANGNTLSGAEWYAPTPADNKGTTSNATLPPRLPRQPMLSWSRKEDDTTTQSQRSENLPLFGSNNSNPQTFGNTLNNGDRSNSQTYSCDHNNAFGSTHDNAFGNNLNNNGCRNNLNDNAFGSNFNTNASDKNLNNRRTFGSMPEGTFGLANSHVSGNPQGAASSLSSTSTASINNLKPKKPSLYQSRPHVVLKVLLSSEQIADVHHKKVALEQRCQTSIGMMSGGITLTGTPVANALCIMHLIQS